MRWRGTSSTRTAISRWVPPDPTSDRGCRPSTSPTSTTATSTGCPRPRPHHSLNIAAQPEIAIVIFDSTASIGQGQAVYVSAHASVVTDDELPQRCAEAFARVGPGAKRFQPHELSGGAALRLYRARATSHEVHIPGRDPVYGAGVDTRRQVTP
jgi:hypothetical protein